MTVYRHPIIAACIAATLFGVALSFRLSYSQAVSPVTQDKVKEEPSLRERQEKRRLVEMFQKLSLSAHSAVLWDVSEGTLVYGKNEETQLPLASLAKGMLALVVKKHLPPGSVITVSGGDLHEEGSSGILTGSTFPVERLIEATLVASLNDTANALSGALGHVLLKEENQSRAKLTGVDLMNQTAQDLKLSQTIFYNEDGLDLGPNQPGALGSAQDVAQYVSLLYVNYPETFLPTTKGDYILRSREGVEYRYFNTNQRLTDIPDLLGSKTGYTDLAGGNLAVVFRHVGKVYTVVVLGSTKEGRFDDAKALVDVLRNFQAGQ